MLKGKNLLTLAEFSSDEILTILDLADDMKRERKIGIFKPLLANRSLAMIFEKSSTRTRVSFDVAMYELGGHALNLSSSELQLSRGETVDDTALVLSRYVDAIMARFHSHSEVVRLAEVATVPVINGLSTNYHPCQILADLQTIRNNKKDFKGLKLAWVGDGNNVCNTLLIGCSKLGISMSVASPKEYCPLSDALKISINTAIETGSRIEVVEEPVVAVRDADVVITDTFISMGLEEEYTKRSKTFFPKYTVNTDLMETAKSDAIFMHCLPAYRGEEVEDKVIARDQSVILDEAENRLHVQKALVCLLLLDKDQISSN